MQHIKSLMWPQIKQSKTYLSPLIQFSKNLMEKLISELLLQELMNTVCLETIYML
jgi:hypothetical protein